MQHSIRHPGDDGNTISPFANVSTVQQTNFALIQSSAVIIFPTLLAVLLAAYWLSRRENAREKHLRPAQVTPGIPLTPESQGLRKKLEGSWRLRAYKLQAQGPLTYTTYPLGQDAAGRLLYSPDGYMSVQIMRPGCASFETRNPHWGTVKENSRATAHYMAYTGRYEVTMNSDGQMLVTHFLDLSLYPNWLETTQARVCNLEGDILTLEPEKLPSFLVRTSPL